MPNRPFRLTHRIRSFRYAIRGIGVMLSSQHNAWIHATVTLAVCGAGAWLELGPSQWCWIVLAIMTVWTAEALNTGLRVPGRRRLAGVPSAGRKVQGRRRRRGAHLRHGVDRGPACWSWDRRWRRKCDSFPPPCRQTAEMIFLTCVTV